MLTLLVGSPRQNPVLDKLKGLLASRRGFEKLELVPPDLAAARIQRAGFELVFVVLKGGRIAESLKTVRALREAGDAQILVVGPATDPKLILGAMQAGGDRFLNEEELEADLDSALARICPRATTECRQLFAVLSASGGCGASTVAVNLAVVLAAEYGRCNLIDLNTNKPDLAPLLDLKPQYTLADLCQNEDRLDRTLYEKLLTGHSSGAALLAGPRMHEDVQTLTPKGMALAVGLAREAFSHVVVDLENWFRDEQAMVLQQATRIFLISRLDFTAIRNARRVLDQFAARGIPSERIQVVINHAGLPNELPLEYAEVALGVKLPNVIPHNPETICGATNAGIPTASADPRSPVVQSIARLVGLDTPAAVGPDLLARSMALYHSRLLPWLRSLRARFTLQATPLSHPLDTEEMKVHHEPRISPEPIAEPRACAV